jgi:hypothetical protein
MTVTLTPDQIASGLVGFFSLSGAVIYGLKKRGLLTIGKCEERRSCPSKLDEVCGDHRQLLTDVATLKTTTADLKEDSGVQLEKLNQICNDISELNGYLRGKGILVGRG